MRHATSPIIANLTALEARQGVRAAVWIKPEPEGQRVGAQDFSSLHPSWREKAGDALPLLGFFCLPPIVL